LLAEKSQLIGRIVELQDEMATNEIKHEAGLAKAKQDAADERAQLERDYQKAKDDIAARDVKITGLEQEKSLAAEMVATVTTEKEDLQEKYVRLIVAWGDLGMLCAVLLWFILSVNWSCLYLHCGCFDLSCSWCALSE
jgi:hypothetical protein